MILLFDAGNSRVKWRGLEDGAFVSGAQKHHDGHLSTELMDEMWGSLHVPASVWGVCVASSSISENITQWALSRWGVEPRYVTASQQLGGVTNGYIKPERLGADRWAALLGAGTLFEGPCCVADCGTAVTVDCMDIHHHHNGGVIMPGLDMMSRCVSENTAQVTLTNGAADILGRDTGSCLAAGAVHAIAGALERIAALVDSHNPGCVKRIITGGDAERILPWLQEAWLYEPDLIFIGLASAIKEIEDKAR